MQKTDKKFWLYFLSSKSFYLRLLKPNLNELPPKRMRPAIFARKWASVL